MFKFLDYAFDPIKSLATFRYEGKDGIIFTETVEFSSAHRTKYDKNLLDRVLFLAFIVLGTSYFKSHPTESVKLETPLSQPATDFFNSIYQEGLSQFAFENHLTRSDLAHFQTSPSAVSPILDDQAPESPTRLVLLSGGKDSLLTAEKLSRQNLSFRSVYISSSNDLYPDIVAAYGTPLVIKRHLDREHLQQSAGKNGHVPVTLINESLALIQAVLSGATEIYVGLGLEGEEPHAFIADLPVNHQWSKTPNAQLALNHYLKTYVSKHLSVRSLLYEKSELAVAGEFVDLCWDKFGNRFSSCNVANYKQDADNQSLKWCGKCPKCANSFLLFAPYLPLEKQPFNGQNLFQDPDLTDTFKGLLGVDGFMKPFECVGSIAELREAYHRRRPEYGDLPFSVPEK